MFLGLFKYSIRPKITLRITSVVDLCIKRINNRGSNPMLDFIIRAVFCSLYSGGNNYRRMDIFKILENINIFRKYVLCEICAA